MKTELFTALCFSTNLISVTAEAEKLKPNIVLIFIDDAGYADFGFQGSKDMLTPNLDKLAQRGIRFTNSYATSPGCGPSRAGLLTGRYQQSFGFLWNNVPGAMDPASKIAEQDMGLPTEEITIAEALKDYGYKTMAIGKWHQGLTEKYHPLRQGFDHFYGFREGSRSYWPYKNAKDSGYFRMEIDFEQFEEPNQYVTDAFGEVATRFIKENSDQPFFLYFAPNAVHAPMEAKEEDMKLFPNLQGKRRILAGMTLALDRAVGNIINQLETSGIIDNTLIVFSNDNGAPPWQTSGSNYPLSGTKGTLYEGGIRVPMIIFWSEHFAGGSSSDAVVSTLDLFPTFIKAAGGDLNKYKQLDGIDLQSYLSLSADQRHPRTLFWSEASVFGIRQGDIKLLDHPDQPAELFNLKDDFEEISNLHYEEIDKVRELFRLLYEWRSTNKRPLWMFKPEEDDRQVKRGHDYRRKAEDKN